MHQQHIIHRDLKSANIRLVINDPDNYDIKIADLGFA